MCLVLLAACSTTHDTNLQGGETNWLSACEDDSTCGAGSCVCDVCSEQCDVDDDCPAGLVCRGPATALVQNSCGASERGLCTPECTRDEDCGDGGACSVGACTILASSGDVDAGVTVDDSGIIVDDATSSGQQVVGYDALINAFLVPDPSCGEVTIDSPVLAAGLVDVAAGGTAESTSCLDPYRIHAWVKSFDRGELIIEGAEVELMTPDRRTIVFNRGELELQNPYVIDANARFSPAMDADAKTEGVVALDLMPVTYLDQLDRFDGAQLIAEVKLIGRDGEGERVLFAATPYGIEVCVGCYTMCLQQDVIDSGLTPADVSDDTRCQDNAGANGAICFDPDC
jgi:hypothetical protein